MLHSDAEGDDPQCCFGDSRGWAMKRGRRRRLLEPKRGRAALRAEIQGQGREVTRGRTAFARTVGHRGNYSWRDHSPDWYGTYGRDWKPKRRRRKARTAAQMEATAILSVYHHAAIDQQLDGYLGFRDLPESDCRDDPFGCNWAPFGGDDPFDGSDHESSTASADASESLASWVDLRKEWHQLNATLNASWDGSTSDASDGLTSCLSETDSSASAPEREAPSGTRVPSPWELAVVRAELAAQMYQACLSDRVPASHSGSAAAKEVKKPRRRKYASERSIERELLEKCNARVRWHDDSSLLDNSKNKDPHKKLRSLPSQFDTFRKEFLEKFGLVICTNLQTCFRGSFAVRAAPLSENIQQSFLHAAHGGKNGVLRPAYHGTNSSNFASIFKNGLVIPGRGNSIAVRNGAAHGVGIYTAEVGSPYLSLGFCSGDRRALLICGVVDDTIAKSEGEFVGRFPLSAESNDIKTVGSASVIFEPKRVAPLFIAESIAPPPQTRMVLHQRGPPRRAKPVSRLACNPRPNKHDSDLARRRLIKALGHSVALCPRSKQRRS